MRKLLLLILVLLFYALPSHAQNNLQHYLGWCTNGAIRSTTSGLNSTNYLQSNYRSCTVTVRNAGTLVLSTLYSDTAATPLANPFTATSAAFVSFFATSGVYDITFSGGSPALASPFTLNNVQLESTAYFPNFGAKCDGTTNDSAALTAANALLTVLGGQLTIPAGRTCVLGTNVTTNQNVEIIFEQNAQFSISTGVTWTNNSPITASRARIVTLNGSGFMSLGTNYRIAEVYPEWWGAAANNSTDNGVPFTAMVNAFDGTSSNPPQTTCGKMTATNGIYLFTTTWTIDSKFSCLFEGTGMGFGTTSTTGSTSLRWGGNSSDPLMRVYGTRDSKFQNFNINSSSSLPLDTGIRIETKTGVTSTFNHFENISFQGTNAGGMTFGVRLLLGSGGDNNNDFMSFTNVTVANYTTAAFRIDGRQPKETKFNNVILGGLIGTSDYGIYNAGSPMSFIGGGGGGNDIADFFFADNGGLNVTSSRFENSAAFFITGGSSNSFPVLIQNVEWAGNGTLAVDLRIINYAFQGPLALIGNNFQSMGTQAVLYRIIPWSGTGAIGACNNGGSNLIAGNQFSSSITSAETMFGTQIPGVVIGNTVTHDVPGTQNVPLDINFGLHVRWCETAATEIGLDVAVGDNAVATAATSRLIRARYGAQVDTGNVVFAVDTVGNIIGAASGAATVGTNAIPYGSVFIGNSGNTGQLTASGLAADRVYTFPDASITVPGTVVTNCATANACSATTVSSTSKIVYGISAALDGASPSLATITGMPAFTSTATYRCTANPVGSAASTVILAIANVSTTSFTITGPNGATSTVNWHCIGS